MATALAGFTISRHPSIIKALPYFQGTLDAADGSGALVNYYAGHNIMVFDDCDGAFMDCPNTLTWSSADCEKLFQHCHDCDVASDISTITVLLAIILQFPSMLLVLQRSSGESTLSPSNCAF